MISDNTDLEQSSAALIDIGVNLGGSAFADDIDASLQRALDAGVYQCVLISSDVNESESLIELIADKSEAFPNMLHSTAGIHPHHASSFSDNRAEAVSRIKSLAKEPAVVAIGETGLDFNRNYSPQADQEQAFEAQLTLAAELGLPVFMHERDAHQRQFEILKNYRDHLVDGVIHCFTGDQQALFNYLDMDLHIGITGWICDERRGLELQRLVHNIPADRLMLETDAPYLLPRTISPKPKSRRNEPAFLPWVLQTVAMHRPETEQQLALLTTTTAQRFFRLNNQHDA